MRSHLFVCLAAVLTACQAPAWQRYPHSLYAAVREGNHVTLQQHQELLQEVIADARSGNRRPPAGIQAEYAYYSWIVGKPALVDGALAAEVRDYPESAMFVTILQRFLPSVPVVESDVKPAGNGGTKNAR